MSNHHGSGNHHGGNGHGGNGSGGSTINPEPSMPIDVATQQQNANTTNQATCSLDGNFTHVEVPAVGLITAGSWVAETEKANIRRNTLRRGV